MSQESYMRGFCKAAEAHGVDPEALMKMAGFDPKNISDLLRKVTSKGIRRVQNHMNAYRVDTLKESLDRARARGNTAAQKVISAEIDATNPWLTNGDVTYFRNPKAIERIAAMKSLSDLEELSRRVQQYGWPGSKGALSPKAK